jgi:Cytochrome P460
MKNTESNWISTLCKPAGVLGIAVILTLFGGSSATSADDGVRFPDGFRDWFVVNSMTATKDSPVFGNVDGMHLIHVNAKGLAALKKSGPFPYPDGTIFADDVHEFSVKDGATVEGAKKFVTVMVKDAKKYALTGGWGFQVWARGDPSKPQVPDIAHSVQACFVCHAREGARLRVFHIHSLRFRTKAKMKAACVRGGPAGVIAIDDLSEPKPSLGQLLVRVGAAGVGPWDAFVRWGKSGLGQALPLILG